MDVFCPFCGKKYTVAETALGKQARCGNPACKQTFTLGASSPPVAPTAAPIVVAPVVAPVAYPPASPRPSSALDDLLAAEMGTPPAMPQPTYPAQGVMYPAPAMMPAGGVLAPAYRRRRSNKVWIIAGSVASGLMVVLIVVLAIVFSRGTDAPAGGLAVPPASAATTGPSPSSVLPGGQAAPGATLTGNPILPVSPLGGGSPILGDSGTGPALPFLVTASDVTAAPFSESLTRGELPKFAAAVPPENTEAIVYLSFERVKASGGMGTIEQMLRSAGNPGRAAELFHQFANEVREILCFFPPDKNDVLIVARASQDVPLEAMTTFAGMAGAQKPIQYAGTSYCRTSQGEYAAKLGPSLILVSQREPQLRAALDRMKQKTATAINPKLLSAIKGHSGHALFSVASPTLGPGAPAIDSVAGGVTLDSNLTLGVCVAFVNPGQAGDAQRQLQLTRQQLNQPMPGPPNPQAQATLSKVRSLIDPIQTSVEGSTLRVNATWPTSLLLGLASDFRGMGLGAGGGPPF